MYGLSLTTALFDVSAARFVASATRRARSALVVEAETVETEEVGAGTGAADTDAPPNAFFWNSASRAATSARLRMITSLSGTCIQLTMSLTDVSKAYRIVG